MTPTARFLVAVGQALAAMALYAMGHPARTRARERLRDALLHAIAEHGAVRLSFMEHDVISFTGVLSELRGWDWTGRFMGAGIGRLEVDAVPVPTDDDLEMLLEALHARLTAPAGAEFAPFAERGVRIGPLGVIAVIDDAEQVDLVDALAAATLSPETDCVRWIHDQVARQSIVPMAEVEAVIHGLAVAMHHDQRIVLPLLELKTQDQYTTTHSCNVAMLTMGLAEEVGLSSGDVRAIGTAALLHDIGKVRVSLDVLVKPGKLTDDEYAEMKRHTVEGARILSARGRGHALAAIVAYEHHVWENGQGGYPVFRYQRQCHYASRLVHVCDLYDALSTDRPYRKAWARHRTLDMLRGQSGVEVDSELVDAFIRLVERTGEQRQPLSETPQDDWNAALKRTAQDLTAPGTPVA
ncbi:HD domain-containing protein [Gemmatimonas sp.]|uniref:HD-GYP domain-containing protein n=1 Tax=Gemmatimonas sp. TaxID=1962908 RepID=UPI0022BEDE9B|nr:HD domain-containing protein [Gemmatimonas sp.]MCZ8205998.1 HD domain-containing protein [Gemmatimonas sp.]